LSDDGLSVETSDETSIDEDNSSPPLLQHGLSYVFSVSCRNRIGWSEGSLNYVVVIPEKQKIRCNPFTSKDTTISKDDCTSGLKGNTDANDANTGEDDLKLGKLWLELFDSVDNRPFWFNTISGERSLKIPPSFVAYQRSLQKANGSSSKEGGEGLEPEDDLLDPIKKFRIKRFKFFKALKAHTNANIVANIAPPSPQPLGSPNPYTAQFLVLKVRRSHMFSDTLQLFKEDESIIKNLHKKTKIIIEGELGIDSGGLTKDWYLTLSRSLAVDSHRIFAPTSSGGLEIHPLSSGIDVDSLFKFRFAGLILGKALLDGQFLDCPFSTVMYKLILGSSGSNNNNNASPVGGLDDLEDVDHTLWKSLKWMTENCVTDVIFETFSVEVGGDNNDLKGGGGRSSSSTPSSSSSPPQQQQQATISPRPKGSGSHKKHHKGKDKKSKAHTTQTISLCEGGDKKDVTEENKLEYVTLMSAWRQKYSVSTQLSSFVDGLTCVVPMKLLRLFTVGELALLFNGKQHIAVNEIRAYTIYQGSSDWLKGDSLEVVWFWQFLRDLPEKKRAAVLKFITGSDRIPLDGFTPPFLITEGSDMQPEDLPRAHTCFNQIVFPRYRDLRTLERKFMYAVEECGDFQMS
jgi:hypothetical protein